MSAWGRLAPHAVPSIQSSHWMSVTRTSTHVLTQAHALSFTHKQTTRTRARFFFFIPCFFAVHTTLFARDGTHRHQLLCSHSGRWAARWSSWWQAFPPTASWTRCKPSAKWPKRIPRCRLSPKHRRCVATSFASALCVRLRSEPPPQSCYNTRGSARPPHRPSSRSLCTWLCCSRRSIRTTTTSSSVSAASVFISF